MSILDIIGVISDDVVDKLAAAGLPPLSDGQIVIGIGKANETSAPPRIVFIPSSFRFGPRSNPANYAPRLSTTLGVQGTGIRSFAMTQYGGGYTTATVTLSAPDIVGGTQATALATITSNGAISRIVPVVVGSGYVNPPTVTVTGDGSGATATANLRPTLEALSVAQQPAFGSVFHRFEVRCWGVNSVGGVISPDPMLDYVATQLLAEQVLASAHSLFPGLHDESDGKWLDAQETAMALDVLGRAATFNLEIACPLLREPIVPTAGASIQYAPPQTQSAPTTLMQPLYGGLLIANATNATPIQITTTIPHGLVTGTNLSIGGCNGNTAANGFWAITVIDGTNFTLNGSTGNGAYTGGGIVGPAGSALTG